MITGDEWANAVNIMADAMEKGAHYYGPHHTQISGDKCILAERALRALAEQFDITRRGTDADV